VEARKYEVLFMKYKKLGSFIENELK